MTALPENTYFHWINTISISDGHHAGAGFWTDFSLIWSIYKPNHRNNGSLGWFFPWQLQMDAELHCAFFRTFKNSLKNRKVGFISWPDQRKVSPVARVVTIDWYPPCKHCTARSGLSNTNIVTLRKFPRSYDWLAPTM